MSKKNGKDHREGESEWKFADFDRMIAEGEKERRSGGACAVAADIGR